MCISNCISKTGERVEVLILIRLQKFKNHVRLTYFFNPEILFKSDSNFIIDLYDGKFSDHSNTNSVSTHTQLSEGGSLAMKGRMGGYLYAVSRIAL